MSAPVTVCGVVFIFSVSSLANSYSAMCWVCRVSVSMVQSSVSRSRKWVEAVRAAGLLWSEIWVNTSPERYWADTTGVLAGRR